MEYFVDLDKASIDALGDMIKGRSNIEVERLDATENKTYNAPSGKAYDPVVVNVPNPSTGTLNITSNDTYDVTDYASAVVNVPNPSTGTLNITESGTYDVTQYASVNVNVQGGVPLGIINVDYDLSDTINAIVYKVTA